MNFLDKLHKLCSPAYVYFMISFVAMLVLVIENLIYGSRTKYCAGSYECIVPSTLLIFVFKFLYVIFWTVILDSLCKYGYPRLSWFLVIFPFLLLAMLIGLMILYTSKHMIMHN